MIDLEFLLEEDLLLELEDYYKGEYIPIIRSKLNDEEYVKSLIDNLKNSKTKMKYTTGELLVVLAFALTVPPGLNILIHILLSLLLAIYIGGGLNEDMQKTKSRQKILNGVNKLIAKLERDKVKAKNKSEKDKIEKEIKKLKHNRDLVENMK